MVRTPDVSGTMQWRRVNQRNCCQLPWATVPKNTTPQSCSERYLVEDTLSKKNCHLHTDGWKAASWRLSTHWVQEPIVFWNPHCGLRHICGVVIAKPQLFHLPRDIQQNVRCDPSQRIDIRPKRLFQSHAWSCRDQKVGELKVGWAQQTKSA